MIINSVFLSNLGKNANQISGTNTPFIEAIFYGVSGFNASGVPVYNTGNIYLGAISGQCPILIATGTSYTLNNINTNSTTQSNLNSLFVAPTNAGDGVYVIYYQ